MENWHMHSSSLAFSDCFRLMCIGALKLHLTGMLSTLGESVNFFGHTCGQTDLQATVLLTSRCMLYLT